MQASGWGLTFMAAVIVAGVVACRMLNSRTRSGRSSALSFASLAAFASLALVAVAFSGVVVAGRQLWAVPIFAAASLVVPLAAYAAANSRTRVEQSSRPSPRQARPSRTTGQTAGAVRAASASAPLDAQRRPQSASRKASTATARGSFAREQASVRVSDPLFQQDRAITSAVPCGTSSAQFETRRLEYAAAGTRTAVAAAGAEFASNGAAPAESAVTAKSAAPVESAVTAKSAAPGSLDGGGAKREARADGMPSSDGSAFRPAVASATREAAERSSGFAVEGSAPITTDDSSSPAAVGARAVDAVEPPAAPAPAAPAPAAPAPAAPAPVASSEPSFDDCTRRARGLKEKGAYAVAARLYRESAERAPDEAGRRAAQFEELACCVKAGQVERARSLADELRGCSDDLTRVERIKLDAVARMT